MEQAERRPRQVAAYKTAGVVRNLGAEVGVFCPGEVVAKTVTE